MLTLNLADVTGVSLSPDDGNQLVVVHIKNNSDLVLSLKSRKNEDLTGELIGVLTAHFDKAFGRSLSVRVSNELAILSGCISKGLTANGPISNLLVEAANGARLRKQSQ